MLVFFENQSERDKMKLIVAIELSDVIREKIGWNLGRYAEDLPDEVECKDWIDSQLQETFENMPMAPVVVPIIERNPNVPRKN